MFIPPPPFPTPVCFQVLAIWGRYDHSVATLRLRLLLADIGKLQQYTLSLHQTALDACTSARTQYVEGQTAPVPSQSGAGQIGSARGPGMAAQGMYLTQQIEERTHNAQ